MSCCAPGAESAAELATAPEDDDETLLSAARKLEDGICQLDLAVPDIHCAACITTIEKSLKTLPMVDTARVNFSTKRVRVSFEPGKGRPSDLTRAIRSAGYRTFLLDPDAGGGTDGTLKTLTRALAVSGFAAGNIMLFSVSIWAGADAMTRDLFHWISALIAIPAVAYAGQPFFRSALGALRNKTLNMDVPISLAVLLALGMSLFETLNHGAEAYFDAAVSLLFFLLIGRTLDHMMREKARGAVRNLARLAPRTVLRVNADGHREAVAIAEIMPGDTIEIAAGERVPVDAEIISGQSELDLSLVNGETVPVATTQGAKLLAGTLNLSGALQLRATRPATDSFLARMIGLMEAAESTRSGYRRIADRAADIYAPAVHLLALIAFLGWGFASGDWHQAMLNGIAVLIVTCPCALALAVPIVHVVAAGRLFESGIMMRDGAALERLGEITRAVFDKTGTLSFGKPQFFGQLFGDEKYLAIAAQLAATSRHPFSQALAAAHPATPAENAKEMPGQGVSAKLDNGIWNLGRAEFCSAGDEAQKLSARADQSIVWLSHNNTPVAAFAFADQNRPEAKSTIAALKAEGLGISLLSGDRQGPVTQLAHTVGIEDAHAGLTPEDKLTALKRFTAAGEKPLMVGDGINDAPALRAAHVSMAPSSAADIGRNAADFIFTRDSLEAVPFTFKLARKARHLVFENFGLAIAYNCVAVPLAVMGHVTPLIAAIAMSSSSILVTLNALRLRLGRNPDQQVEVANPTELQFKPAPAE